MSYSDFTLMKLQDKFELDFVENQILFDNISNYAVSAEFLKMLHAFIPLATAIDTEKARSELIVAPLLAMFKLEAKNLSLFSGIEFNVDQNAGLTGRCDFILSKSSEQYRLEAPVLLMVEAKNDNIKSGIAQCGAEMVAAQFFNLERHNNIASIYGCVTTGSLWRFLKLIDKQFYIDVIEYHIYPPERILGILSFITQNNDAP
jgi:hypothetical protein